MSFLPSIVFLNSRWELTEKAIVVFIFSLIKEMYGSRYQEGWLAYHSSFSSAVKLGPTWAQRSLHHTYFVYPFRCIKYHMPTLAQPHPMSHHIKIDWSLSSSWQQWRKTKIRGIHEVLSLTMNVSRRTALLTAPLLRISNENGTIYVDTLFCLTKISR